MVGVSSAAAGGPAATGLRSAGSVRNNPGRRRKEIRGSS